MNGSSGNFRSWVRTPTKIEFSTDGSIVCGSSYMILKIEIIDGVFALESRDKSLSSEIQRSVERVWSESLTDFCQIYTTCYEHFSNVKFNPLWDETKIGPYDSVNRFNSFFFILTMIKILSAKREITLEIAPSVGWFENKLIRQANAGKDLEVNLKWSVVHSIDLKKYLALFVRSFSPTKLLSSSRAWFKFLQVLVARANRPEGLKEKRGCCVIYLPDGYSRDNYLAWRAGKNVLGFCNGYKTISFFANGDDCFFNYLKFTDLYKCFQESFRVTWLRIKLDFLHSNKSPNEIFFLSSLSYWYLMRIVKCCAAKRYFEISGNENITSLRPVRKKFITFEGIYNKQTAYLNRFANKNGYLTIHINSRQLNEFRPSSRIPACYNDAGSECLPKEMVVGDYYSMEFLKRRAPLINLKLISSENKKKLKFAQRSEAHTTNKKAVVVIVLQRKQDGRSGLLSIAEECLTLGSGVVLKEHPGFPLEFNEILSLNRLSELAVDKGVHFSRLKHQSLDTRLNYIACVSVYSSFPMEEFEEGDGIIWVPFLSFSAIVMRPIMKNFGKLANNKSELTGLLKERLGGMPQR